MGFKKGKSGKDKKKKKSKSKGKKDEWSFEGGQTVDHSAVSGNGLADRDKSHDPKRMRRETQDRDERFRRSRMKMSMDKQNKDSRIKMSTKVSFTDVLSEEESENEVDGEHPAKKSLRAPSSLSHLDRLDRFVSKSLKKRQIDETMRSNGDSSADKDNGGNVTPPHISESKNSSNSMQLAASVDGDHIDSESVDGVVKSMEGVLLPGQFMDSFFATKENTVYLDGDAMSRSTSLSAATMKKLLPVGSVGQLYGELNFSPEAVCPPVASFLKLPSLHRMWEHMRAGTIAGENSDEEQPENSADIAFSDLGANLLPYLKTFADAFLEGRDEATDDEFVDLMAAHAISHIVSARSKVLKHTQKLKTAGGESAIAAAQGGSFGVASPLERRAAEKKKSKLDKRAAAASKAALKSAVDMEAAAAARSLDDLSAGATGGEDQSVMHDQGFCRPRVLILCPFRSQAKQLVDAMNDLLGPNTSVTGMDKFEEEFGYTLEEDEDDSMHDDNHSYIRDGGGKRKKAGDDASRPRKNGSKEETLRSSKKPPDWLATFKDNTDDDFKIGIQINPGKGKGTGAAKGVHMRLFSDFYISDIVVASPIGLRLSMEKNGSGDDKRSNDRDFLSSVEIVILQQADVMYMQNWEHVEFVLHNCNQLPSESRDTDYSRVRPYFLDGLGAVHRQLIVNTNFNDPEIQSTFRQHAKSLAGRIRLRKDWLDGVINQVANTSTQVFQRISRIKSFGEVEDKRFTYFKESILDPLLRNMQSRTLIVAPSYLHYVRIRNYLMQQKANAAYVCEYSRESEISRGRSNFFHGHNDILLYSGRAHFFRRFFFRGAQHLIFYSLPQYAHFYSEMVNMLSEADVDHHKQSGTSGGVAKLTCLVLFTQYDRMALERVVGVQRCAHMLSAENTMTFMFK